MKFQVPGGGGIMKQGRGRPGFTKMRSLLLVGSVLLAGACYPPQQGASQRDDKLVTIIEDLQDEMRDRRRVSDAETSRAELRRQLRSEIDEEFGRRFQPIEGKLARLVEQVTEAEAARARRGSEEEQALTQMRKSVRELRDLVTSLSSSIETDSEERAALVKTMQRVDDRTRRLPTDLDSKMTAILDEMRDTLGRRLDETLEKQKKDLTAIEKKVDRSLAGIESVDEKRRSFEQELDTKHEKTRKELARSVDDGLAKQRKDLADFGKSSTGEMQALAGRFEELRGQITTTSQEGRKSLDLVGERLGTLGESVAKLEKAAETRSAEEQSARESFSEELDKLLARINLEAEHRKETEKNLLLRIDALGKTVTEGLRVAAGTKKPGTTEPGEQETGPEGRQEEGVAAARNPNGNKKPSGGLQGAFGEGLWNNPWLLVIGVALLLSLLYLLLRQDAGVKTESVEEARPLIRATQVATKDESAMAVVHPEPAKTRKRGKAPPPPAPRCHSLRVPAGEVISGGDEAVRNLLTADPRVLVEPAPRVEWRSDGSLSIRFYVVGGLASRESDELMQASRVLVTREEETRRKGSQASVEKEAAKP